MKRLNQSGSHIVALAFLVLVLGAVAFAGYTVMQHHKKTPVAATTSRSAAASTAAPIQNQSDLQSTATSLDSGSSDLNTGMDSTTLSSSMNDLL